jgi:hypothetical protein
MVVPVYFCFFSSATLITSFILFQGLKASAVDLITMVLGFLVICLGITLLQMSKVDPKVLTNLDRRSTMLFAASQHQTEEAEKGHVTALEDPGIDALRGGFGAVGSIIRARSASRRFSNASSMAGGRYPYAPTQNLSTAGMGNVQRFQRECYIGSVINSTADNAVSDAPMPHDALDQVSMHSNNQSPAPFNTSNPYTIPPKRSKSHLKFEEEDLVHQYGYGRGGQEMHYSRPHYPHALSHHRADSAGSGTFRHGSALYPAVVEEGEVEGVDAGAASGLGPLGEHDHEPSGSARGNPFPPMQHRKSFETDHQNRSSPISASAKLSNLFHIAHSHAPRPGSNGRKKSTKDYPRTGEDVLEREERANLVSQMREDDDDDPHADDRDGSGSGEADGDEALYGHRYQDSYDEKAAMRTALRPVHTGGGYLDEKEKGLVAQSLPPLPRLPALHIDTSTSLPPLDTLAASDLHRPQADSAAQATAPAVRTASPENMATGAGAGAGTPRGSGLGLGLGLRDAPGGKRTEGPRGPRGPSGPQQGPPGR